MKPLTLAAAGATLVVLGGVAVLSDEPLVARGPAEVRGVPATAVYRIADSPVREVRYVDRQRLTYVFALHNAGPVPVTVTGLVFDRPAATLLRPERLTDPTGATRFRIGAGDDVRVELRVLMTDCERVSSRAGSLLDDIRIRLRTAGLVPRTVTVPLPERVRTQSPRDAACPRSSPATRPPG